MVRGPTHCLRRVRRLTLRDDPLRCAGVKVCFLTALKATGVNSSRLRGKSTSQAKVEARYTSSPRSAKCRIQFFEMGERPSATNSIFIRFYDYTLPVNGRRSNINGMSKGRILIVEDNMDTYELVHFILEKNGFETFLAVNGRDGVNAALKQRPNLIIMDMSMPEMDGWTATALIKKNEMTSSIPLIALTAHALPGDRQRAMDAGCDEYITKPMDLDELVEAIQYWVNRQH